MSSDNPQVVNPLEDSPPVQLRRECFVTIGATAGFEALLAAAVSEQTLLRLKKFNYTHLTVQVGELESFFNQTKPEDTQGIVIKSFTFKKDGLTHNMKKCRAKPGVSEEGLVVCHAGLSNENIHCPASDLAIGSGTILDAMRLGVPLVVVPNSSLLDNHQDELADELEKQGYVTKGSPR